MFENETMMICCKKSVESYRIKTEMSKDFGTGLEIILFGHSTVGTFMGLSVGSSY